MEHIDEHIKINREAIQALDTVATEATNNIGSNTVSEYAGKTLWQAIATLYNTISNVTTGSTAGIDAWT